MPRVILVGLLLIVSVFLEGTLIALPLLVVAVVISAVMFRGAGFVFTVFMLGVIFDTLAMQSLGQTSVFLLVVIGLIELYDKKFEVRTLPFVIIACAVCVSLYLVIFGSYAFVVQLGVAILFAGLFYLMFMKAGFIVKE